MAKKAIKTPSPEEMQNMRRKDLWVIANGLKLVNAGKKKALGLTKDELIELLTKK